MYTFHQVWPTSVTYEITQKGDTLATYNIGDGNLTYSATNLGNINDGSQPQVPLQFGQGISASDVTFYKDPSTTYGDLIVQIKEGGQLTIQDYFFNPDPWAPNPPPPSEGAAYSVLEGEISSFELHDGTPLSINPQPIYNNVGTSGNDTLTATSIAPALWGKAGDDTLIGYNGPDTLVGGAGNDLLEGGTVSNTYLFWAGSGNDTITAPTGGWNQINFETGVNTSNIIIAPDSQDNIYISYDSNPADQITIKSGTWINRIQTADGSYMSGNGLNLLMQEMAAYATQHNEPLNSIADAKADPNLLAMITAAWHH